MEAKFNIVFKRLKEVRLDENILCSEFWRKIIILSENFNETDCWQLVKENIEWLINTKTITTDELTTWFSKNQLFEQNIFIEGISYIKDGFAVGIKTANIEATGHSRIMLFDNARCKAFDSTFVSGYHNSKIELKNCVADAFNNCEVIAKDFSKVEAWDNVIVKAKTFSCVMAHDNAQVENSENSHTVIL